MKRIEQITTDLKLGLEHDLQKSVLFVQSVFLSYIICN